MMQMIGLEEHMLSNMFSQTTRSKGARMSYQAIAPSRAYCMHHARCTSDEPYSGAKVGGGAILAAPELLSSLPIAKRSVNRGICLRTPRRAAAPKQFPRFFSSDDQTGRGGGKMLALVMMNLMCWKGGSVVLFLLHSAVYISRGECGSKGAYELVLLATSSVALPLLSASKVPPAATCTCLRNARVT